MIDLNNILAKSIQNGNTTLLDHTRHVVTAIKKMAEGFSFPFDEQIAIKGAVLHDLGKAHPHFQKRMKNINAHSLADEREDESYIHRHELSSLAFLKAFPKEEWNTLIDMVVAHHKSIQNDIRNRGILDLDDNDRYWIENHLKDWEEWFPVGKEILKKFGFECKDISYDEAKKALEYAADYCYHKKKGWSRWRGLLKAADHFGSAFMVETEKQTRNLFEIPDLSFYRDKKRGNELYPLSGIDVSDPRKHTLVIAPTGAGKTDFLLKRTHGRVFYTLPFQASINAMWKRFKDTIPTKDIRLLHATSKIVVGKNLEEQILQPLAGSSVKVLTPHQLAAIIFGTAGYESMMLDVEGCDVILDEVHTYSDYSQAMVLEIVKALLILNCRIHIGTATMPSVLYNQLLSMLGGNESVYEVKLSNDILRTFNRHQIFKVEDESEIDELLQDAFSKNEKVLVVYNTVKKAQESFGIFEEKYPDVKRLLIHSRFKRGDRFARELTLKKDFDESKVNKPCLVVSTQVVEVSLDISFDRMITMGAPLDSLIQRFGRVNRRRTKGTIGHYKPVYVLKPEGKALPYKSEVLNRSFEQLPDNGEVLEETEIQLKIDEVFPNLDLKQIDIHLKFRDGQITMKELTDNKKSVIVEALEIESATCILEEDRDTYMLANWEERINMEIPINWRTIARYKDDYEQLEIGSHPFVIPQNPRDYEKYGLQLTEPETFL